MTPQALLVAFLALSCRPAASVGAFGPPGIRRRLDALPGFNVGTQTRGMDVARNGEAIEWQKWDAQKGWAWAGSGSNSFFVWFEPNDDGKQPANQTFEISAASVASPNEANCSVNTTPPFGQPIVAGNFTTTFEASYACVGIGQSTIQLVLAVDGYSSITIEYVKTNGNALDVALELNASDVVALGSTTPRFALASPQYVVPYAVDSTTFFIRVSPGQLPHTLTEPLSSAINVTYGQEQVVEAMVTGTASTATTYGETTLVLLVNYTCKVYKDLTSSTIEVRSRVRACVRARMRACVRE
jgi:hypothetical protein